MKMCCLNRIIYGARYLGRYSLVVGRPEIDPHLQHILSCRFGLKNISTAILPPSALNIQVEHLSVNGERKCTKYSGRLAQEQYG